MPEYKMDSRSGRTAVLPTWCFDIGPRTGTFLAERGFQLEPVAREGEWYRLKQPFQLIVQGDPPYALIRQGEAFVDAALIASVSEREERAKQGAWAAATWDEDGTGAGAPLPKADFTDAHSVHVAEAMDALEAARRMVGRRPQWVDGLLVLRNLAVTPLGLKRSAPATTFVRTRNRLGRLYMAVVKPFHRVIVPAMLAQVGRS
jgi:hypothetical protein